MKQHLIKACLVSLLIALGECQCTGSRQNGDYRMSWNAYGGVVQFDVSVVTDNGTWIALGFGGQPSMVQSDIVIGSLSDNGLSFVEDRWASVRAMPSYDADQDIRNTSMNSENGEMMMSFIRDIYTTKQSDSTLGSQCMYILSAWGGNVLSYSTPATFSKHTQKGVISQLICLQQCTDGITPTPAVSSATTSSILSSTPQSTTDSSSDGFSIIYIGIIVILGSLISIAVCLGLLLACICFATRNKHQSRAVYQFEATAMHPKTRRETMTRTAEMNNVLPSVSEYQEEVFNEQNLYDDVAHDQRPRLDSFTSEDDTEPQYDLPAREIPRVPTVDEEYDDMQGRVAPVEKPMVNKHQPSTREQQYEDMQYDPIRHILN